MLSYSRSKVSLPRSKGEDGLVIIPGNSILTISGSGPDSANSISYVAESRPIIVGSFTGRATVSFFENPAQTLVPLPAKLVWEREIISKGGSDVFVIVLGGEPQIITFGGPKNDAAAAVTPTCKRKGADFVIAGYFTDELTYDLNTVNKKLIGQGMDGFIMRTNVDFSGEPTLWVFSGPGDDYARAVAVRYAENPLCDPTSIVVGGEYSNSLDLGGFAGGHLSGPGMFIVNIDLKSAAQQASWATSIRSEQTQFLGALALDCRSDRADLRSRDCSEADILVAGAFHGKDVDFGNGHLLTSTGKSDIFLMKLCSNTDTSCAAIHP